MKQFYKLPIYSNIKIKLDSNLITISGPLGILNLQINPVVEINQKNNFLYFSLKDTFSKKNKSILITTKNLINQKMIGLNKGFIKFLEIIGVGWRFFLEDDKLILKIGYSYLITYNIPKNVEVFLIDKQVIKIFGLDYLEVTQFAANLIKLKPRDSYKGKGIDFKEKFKKLKPSSKSK